MNVEYMGGVPSTLSIIKNHLAEIVSGIHTIE